MHISSRQYLEATSQLSIDDDTSQNELFAKLGARKCFRDVDANRNQAVTQEEISAVMARHGMEVYPYYVSKWGEPTPWNC